MSYVFSIKIFSYYYIIQFDLILIRYIIRLLWLVLIVGPLLPRVHAVHVTYFRFS